MDRRDELPGQLQFSLANPWIPPHRSLVGVQPPLHLVRRDLLGRGVLLLHEHLDLELVGQFDRLVIQRDIVLEDLGNRRLLENRLPRTFRLARTAIDAFVGIYVELIGKLNFVVADIHVDAIDRADTDASGVNAIPAEPGDCPWHSRISPVAARPKFRMYRTGTPS